MVLGNDAHQILQAGLHPLVAGGVAPVLLGGEVHDEPFARCQTAILDHQHAAGGQLATAAGIGINGKVVRERLLEMQSYPLAHHAHGVDGVHQCLGTGLQQSFDQSPFLSMNGTLSMCVILYIGNRCIIVSIL